MLGQILGALANLFGESPDERLKVAPSLDTLEIVMDLSNPRRPNALSTPAPSTERGVRAANHTTTAAANPPACSTAYEAEKKGANREGLPPSDPSNHTDNSLHDRTTQAWDTWLNALASDAHAALGAALAYQDLDSKGRDAMLQALEQDSKRLGVPRIAVFAPLLSVEHDEARRQRICTAVGTDVGATQVCARALVGTTPNADRVIMILTPVYLHFVKVTSCRLAPDQRIRWVRCEPLVHINEALHPNTRLDDTALELVPLQVAIDLIARAIVGQRRNGEVLPPELLALVQLFSALDGQQENDAAKAQ